MVGQNKRSNSPHHHSLLVKTTIPANYREQSQTPITTVRNQIAWWSECVSLQYWEQHPHTSPSNTIIKHATSIKICNFHLIQTDIRVYCILHQLWHILELLIGNVLLTHISVSFKLQDCLELFFQQNTLTRNNQILCSSCGIKRDTAVLTSISKAPEILILHLKR